jgi:hypothetical protein
MGLKADCVVRYKGTASAGRAHLEPRELVFRGDDLRVKLPIDAATKASVKAGRLYVKSGREDIELELGAAAARVWADRIQHPKSRIEKLGIKQAATVAMVRVSDKDVLHELKGAGATLVKTPQAGSVDVVFFRARKAAELAELARLERLISRTGAIWVIYPKGVEPIREADVMDAAKSNGLVTVKVTAFSDSESALKLVVPVARR